MGVGTVQAVRGGSAVRGGRKGRISGLAYVSSWPALARGPGAALVLVERLGCRPLTQPLSSPAPSGPRHPLAAQVTWQNEVTAGLKGSHSSPDPSWNPAPSAGTARGNPGGSGQVLASWGLFAESPERLGTWPPRQRRGRGWQPLEVPFGGIEVPGALMQAGAAQESSGWHWPWP